MKKFSLNRQNRAIATRVSKQLLEEINQTLSDSLPEGALSLSMDLVPFKTGIRFEVAVYREDSDEPIVALSKSASDFNLEFDGIMYDESPKHWMDFADELEIFARKIRATL